MTNVSACPSIFFKSSAHAKLWDSVTKRTLIRERITLYAKDFKGSRIKELLGEDQPTKNCVKVTSGCVSDCARILCKTVNGYRGPIKSKFLEDNCVGV